MFIYILSGSKPYRKPVGATETPYPQSNKAQNQRGTFGGHTNILGHRDTGVVPEVHFTPKKGCPSSHHQQWGGNRILI